MRLLSALALEICQRQNKNSNWIKFLQGKFQYGLILNLWYGYNSLCTIITVTTRALSTCRKQINKNACAYDIDFEEVPFWGGSIELGNVFHLILPEKIQDKRVKGYVCENSTHIFSEEIKKKNRRPLQKWGQ